MVDIQIVTNGNPAVAKTYWKWKVVSTPEEPAPADVGMYRDVTLAKVILEYTRLKYNQTNPSKTDILWTIDPFMQIKGYHIVVKEGETLYEEHSWPNYIAHTDIFIECYTTHAVLGETFFNLENMMLGCQDAWFNYDSHRVNGLAFMNPKNKTVPNEGIGSKDRAQTTDSIYVKTLYFEAIYQIQRITEPSNVTFTYDLAETAGSYATN